MRKLGHSRAGSGPLYAQQRETVGKTHPMANKGPQGRLGATDSGPRPGGFPLGSAQSRAAARGLLEHRRAVEGAGTLFVLERIGSGHGAGQTKGGKCTCPVPPAGAFALCRCFV